MGYPAASSSQQNFEDLRSLQGQADSMRDEAQEVTDQVLRRQVPWDTYQKADLISDRELQLIKRYDKQDRTLQRSLLQEEDGVLYVRAFFSLLRSIASEEVVQYVLALLEDMIREGGARSVTLLGAAAEGEGSSDASAILLRMLQRPDWFTKEKAAVVLSNLLSRSQDPVAATGASTSASASAGLKSFVEWLCTELRTPSAERSERTAVTCLSLLLKSGQARQIFLRASGVGSLCARLTPLHGTQTLYECCLCLWLLSFSEEATEELCQLNVPKKLVEVVGKANKEKVLRVALMCLENTLKGLKAADGNSSAGESGGRYDKVLAKLLECGLGKSLEVQRLQAHTDEELLMAMESLEEQLIQGVKKEISSFDKYADEVFSGTLDWTWMHKQDKFFKMNAGKFVDKDCAILRALARILESSTDERSLEVACHDIGQFIQHFAHGRGYLKRLKVKQQVMKLMTHADAEVAKQALMCCQKLMLSKDSLDLLSFS